ncbi:MAG: hypothetical protein ACFFDB_00335 [Promethearchaeota archaeon]
MKEKKLINRLKNPIVFSFIFFTLSIISYILTIYINRSWGVAPTFSELILPTFLLLIGIIIAILGQFLKARKEELEKIDPNKTQLVRVQSITGRVVVGLVVSIFMTFAIMSVILSYTFTKIFSNLILIIILICLETGLFLILLYTFGKIGITFGIVIILAGVLIETFIIITLLESIEMGNIEAIWLNLIGVIAFPIVLYAVIDLGRVQLVFGE